MAQQIYDISRRISPELVVWPGDTPFSYRQLLDKRQSASVNLTTLTLSAHTGSHADAPWHFMRTGISPADMPLDKFIGPAHVASIDRKQGGITPDDFKGKDLEGVKRLLIHTWVSDSPDHEWPEDFPYLTTDLVDWLGEKQVVLMGVDMPSVDSFDSEFLPAHHRMHRYDMVNLEMLMLKGVPDGVYELIALPLKFTDVDGSPVRAILRTLDSNSPKPAPSNGQPESA
jgi:arylformamidase